MAKKKGWVLLLNMIILVGLQTAASSTSNPSQQQEKDRVIELPGLSVNVSFAHYSGYVNVNEESGRNLFYWFIEAVEDPSSKPIVLWLQGGPGCSSIGFGEAQEIGPFHINADGKTIYLNPYSWNQVANILFLDSPVGTGFSYTNNASELLTNGDKRTADDSLVFLLKWFERFPQYKGRDFYITGESYAGHYIPQLAQAILQYQQPTSERSINLKGQMAGNAITDDFNDQSGVSEFLWSTGLISDQSYKLRKLFCHPVSFLHSSDDCQKIADVISRELGNIDIYSIYTPACTNKSSNLKLQNINEEYDPCTRDYTAVYFNLPEVKKALHVNPDAPQSEWQLCNRLSFNTWKDSASSVLNIYHEIIASGLRIWMFSGDTDTVVPVTSTRYDIEALGLPAASPWRPWYIDEQVGGWTQEYAGLNFVTIRGAGHMVPMTNPKQALILFKSFLSGTSMPSKSPKTTDA